MSDPTTATEHIRLGIVTLGSAVAAGDCRELQGEHSCVVSGLPPGEYTAWGSTIEIDGVAVAGRLVLVVGTATELDHALLEEGDPEPMNAVWTWGPLGIVDEMAAADLSDSDRFPFGDPPPVTSSDEVGQVESRARFALIHHDGLAVGASVIADYVDTEYEVFAWGDEQGDPFAVGYVFHVSFLPGTSAFRS